MRILHWYPNFLGGGGVANAVLGLAQAQAELGAEIAIASAEAEGTPLYQAMDQALGRVRLFRWHPRWRVRAGRLIWRKISTEGERRILEFNPDIIHVHGEFNPDNFHVARIFDALIILSPHGAFHPVVLVKSKASLKKLYILLAQRFFYPHVSLFHALNPAEGEHIRQVLGLVNIYILPQGPSTNVLSAIKENHADRYDEIRFIFVGRLDTYTKGLDILVEAFAEALRRLHGAARLILVGPDQRGSLERLKNMALKNRCAEKIHFIGAVPGRKVAEFIAQNDIYIHLSRHEVFGFSVAEALCAGKPSILSDRIGTVSYREIASLPHVKVIPPVKEAAVQAMVEFADRIEALKAAGMSCREDVLRFFDWERIAKGHLRTYEKYLRTS